MCLASAMDKHKLTWWKLLLQQHITFLMQWERMRADDDFQVGKFTRVSCFEPFCLLIVNTVVQVVHFNFSLSFVNLYGGGAVLSRSLW